MRSEIFPAISVNKDVTVISNCSPQCKPVSSEDPQEGEEYLLSSSHQTMATSWILAPDAEVRMKGMISVSPDSWIFPYREKC